MELLFFLTNVRCNVAYASVCGAVKFNFEKI